MTLPRFLQFIQHRGGKSAGAIRASLGVVSNFRDAYRFFRFAADFRDQTTLTLGGVTFDVDSCRVIRTCPRLTAWELWKDDIDVRVSSDNMAGVPVSGR